MALMSGGASLGVSLGVNLVLIFSFISKYFALSSLIKTNSSWLNYTIVFDRFLNLAADGIKFTLGENSNLVVFL